MSFDDTRIERDFRDEAARRFGFMQPVIAVLAAFVFFSFGFFDQSSARAGELAAVRTWIVVPGFLLLALLGRDRRLRPYWEWLTVLTAMAALAAMTWIHLVYEASSPYGVSTPAYALNTTLLMATMVVVPLGLAATVLACSIVAAVYVLAVAMHADLGAAAFFSNLVNVVFIAIACAGIAGYREWMTRQAFLERRRMRDQRDLLEFLAREILSPEVLESAKRGERTPPRAFGEVSILFADLTGFTKLTGRLGPHHLVELLDRLFSEFDELAAEFRIEKVKTIGDAYMAVGGADDYEPDLARRTVALGFAMIERTAELAREHDLPIGLRVGVHVGSAIGGVIGRSKMAFDFWGDAVNLASRLESNGEPGRVQVSEPVWLRVRGDWPAGRARTIEMKGKGPVDCWLLEPPEAADPQSAR